MKFMIILLLATSASACLKLGGQGSPLIDWQKVGKEMNLPGHTSYNPNTQKCCKGKVSGDPYRKCCGDNTYDSNTQVCCDGTPLKMVYGQSCCGKTLYNPRQKDTRCCYGKVHQLKEDEINHVACCGQLLYRPGSEICCGDDSKGKGVVLPIPEGRNYSCCDTKAYDEDTQVCCLEFSETGPEVWESNIIPLEGNNRDCCGGKGFDVDTHMCCVDVPVDRNLECCGGLGYDPKTEACCVHPPPEGSKYPGVSKIPKTDEDTKCCDGKPYEQNTQSCCDDKVVEGTECPADGNQPPRQEPTTAAPIQCAAVDKLCCGGIEVEKKSPNDVCCYDVQTDEPIFPWGKPSSFGK